MSRTGGHGPSFVIVTDFRDDGLAFPAQDIYSQGLRFKFIGRGKSKQDGIFRNLFWAPVYAATAARAEIIGAIVPPKCKRTIANHSDANIKFIPWQEFLK